MLTSKTKPGAGVHGLAEYYHYLSLAGKVKFSFVIVIHCHHPVVGREQNGMQKIRSRTWAKGSRKAGNGRGEIHPT